MTGSVTDTSIESIIIETKPVDWKSFKFIQQDSFKALTAYEKSRLKHSLVSNNFMQPFYVWEHDGVTYCLDGRHRSIALHSLIDDGKKVPDQLPATFLKLQSKAQAAKMVLLFSSHYAHITKEGLDDFLSIYDLDINQVLEEISLPDMPALLEAVLPEPDDLIGDGKNKPATMKLTFDTSEAATFPGCR